MNIAIGIIAIVLRLAVTFAYRFYAKQSSDKARMTGSFIGLGGAFVLTALFFALYFAEGSYFLMIGLGAFAFIDLVVFSFRLLLENYSKSLESVSSDELLKKYPDVDLGNYRRLMSFVGLASSFLIIFAVFEWTERDQGLMDLGSVSEVLDEPIIIPPTDLPPPPPEKPPEIIKQPEIKEAENDDIEEVEIELDMEMEEDESVEVPMEVVEEEEPEEKVTDEIFTIVEQSAEPEGGMKAFYNYVKKALKYPRQAKKMGVEGRVFIQFIVDKDGSITNVKTIRGIGAGCDKEAERVVSAAPKWKPAKQRGRAVKQRMSIPIVFKLSK